MSCCLPSCEKLKVQQAQLWDDHYWYTRQVIRDAASGSPCFNVDLVDLYETVALQGQNFGCLTECFKAGVKLTRELVVHVNIAIQIVQTVLAGQDYSELYRSWQANATKIACIYHKYHHEIKFKTMDEMMQEYLDSTLTEAAAIISGDCQRSSETGKMALAHIRMMSAYINCTFHCKPEKPEKCNKHEKPCHCK